MFIIATSIQNCTRGPNQCHKRIKNGKKKNNNNCKEEMKLYLLPNDMIVIE